MRAFALAILALAFAFAEAMAGKLVWGQDPNSEKTRSGGHVRKEIWKDGAILKLQVPISDESRHLMTAVTFPEESIQGIVQGWGESDISLDHKKGTLYVKLLKAAEGHLYVVGSSRTKYTLYIIPVDAAKEHGSRYDAELQVEKEKTAGDKKSEEARLPTKGQHGKPIGSLDLVRAMRLGIVPENGTVKRGDGRGIFKTEKLAATLAYKYDTLAYAGYVLDVANTSSGTVALDLSRFSAPGGHAPLVLVGAREMTVESGQATRIYLVFWKD